MSFKLLVSGGAGFIGSNFIKQVIDNNIEIYNLDALTYAGNLENLSEIEGRENYHFLRGDIRDRNYIDNIFSEYNFNAVINFAAESHVDRSIMDSTAFVETNVMGTVSLLDISKKYNVDRFLQVSTDEVYGSLGKEGKFTEKTPLQPNSPYSASKASADNFVRAYHETFSMDTVITRCSNNYGSYQFPEKLIPLMINNAQNNKKLPVYGDGKNVRDWIHVEDHCAAIWEVFKKGKAGEVYNVGAESEKENIEIVKLILSELGKSEDLIEYVSDRPGHDRRYAIDNSKIYKEIGWKPKYKFEDGIKQTISWYLNNEDWLKNVLDGSYQEYYEKQYTR